MTIVWALLTLIGKWLPHTANYSPEIAMVVYLANRYSFLKASILAIATVEIADIGVALIYGYPFFGDWSVVNACTLLAIILCCLRPWSQTRMMDAISKVSFAALFYWILTNLGVWLNGDGYLMTFSGLMQCYGMALPFLPAQLVSGLVFTVLGLIAYRFWGKMLSSKKETIINGDVAVQQEVMIP